MTDNNLFLRKIEHHLQTKLTLYQQYNWTSCCLLWENYKDSVKTSYNEGNVVLEEAKWVRSGFRIRTPGPSCMGATVHENSDPPKSTSSRV